MLTPDSKYIPVEKLSALLSQLLSTDKIFPNRVGNLSVVRDGEYIGYIDLAAETLTLFSDTSTA